MVATGLILSHLHNPGLWRMQWQLVSNSTGSTKQGCPLCDTVALDDSNINTTHPVRLAKHQAADHVPQPGPYLQGQDGQEA